MILYKHTQVIAILIILGLAYLAIFGRALKQAENHFGIFFALPKVIFSSEAVAIDNQKYLAKNTTAFIKTMEAEGFSYIDQMGSGHFLEKDGVRYLSVSQMYSSHFMVFTVPVVAGQSSASATASQLITIDPQWLKISQAVSDCQVVSVMQTHRRIVTVDLKDGRQLEAIEPELDDIMQLALAAEKKCGRIIMVTE